MIAYRSIPLTTAIWEKVKESLQLTVRLVAQFGFNGHTLTASNAIIPIAYYIYGRKEDDESFSGEKFLTDENYADDRETIRGWLLKILLGKAFRGTTDQALTNIRTVIQATPKESSSAAFPANAINKMLRSSGRFLFYGGEYRGVGGRNRVWQPRRLQHSSSTLSSSPVRVQSVPHRPYASQVALHQD